MKWVLSYKNCDSQQGVKWNRAQKILVCCFILLFLCLAIGCVYTPLPVLPFVVIVVAGIIVLALIYPIIAACLLVVCASIPSYTLPIPGYHLHLVEPATLLCVMVIIARRLRGSFSSVHLYAAAFLGIACISFLHVPEFSSGSSPYGADKSLLTLCFIFAAFFSGTFIVTTIRAISTFLVVILLLSLLPYVIALSQALNFPLFPMLEATGAHTMHITQGRLWGPFPWSVNFAMYLVNLFAISLACWLLGEKRRHRVAGLLLTIVTALVLFGTGTRSAVLAAVCILLLALIIVRRFKILLFSIVVMLLCSILFGDTLFHLFLHDDTSTNNRLLIWSEAINLVYSHPWLGIGLQQFHYYYSQLIVSKGSELGAQGIHPHEQYLEWAMESGIFWLIIGILFVISAIVACLDAYYRVQHALISNKEVSDVFGRGLRPLLLAASLALIANSIIGFFDAPLDQLEGALLLLFLVGMATGYAAHIKHVPLCERMPALSRCMPFHLLLAGSMHALSSPFFVWKPPNLFREDTTVSAVSMRQGTLAELTTNNMLSMFTGPQERIRKTGHSVLLQTLSWAIALPLIFPMTALLTRYLGPVRYGEYSLTFPFFTIFALLSGTGMDALLVRQLSTQPRFTWSTILGGAIATRLLSTLGSSIVAFIIACLLPIVPEQRDLFLLGSISLFFSFSFNGVRIVYTHGFRAEQRIGLLCLIETLNRIVSAALVPVVVLLHLSLLWAYALLIYADLPAFCWLLVVAHRRFHIRVHMRRRYIRFYLLESLPLIGHNVLSLLVGQVDLLFLMLLAGPFATGIYALASRITDPLIAIALAYTNGFYPLFCRTYTRSSHAFVQSYYHATRLLILIIVPIAGIIMLAVQPIVALLAGTQFSSATTVVQLLMGAMVFTFLSQVTEKACVAAHLEKRLFGVAMISLSISVVMNVLLIARWSIIGAGVASLSTEVLTLCLNLFLLRKTLLTVSITTFIRMITFIAANAFTLLFLSTWTVPIYWQLPLFLILFFIYALLSHTFIWQDLHDLKTIMTLRIFMRERQYNFR